MFHKRHGEVSLTIVDSVYKKADIRLVNQPNWLGRLFKIPQYSKKWTGSCTVWHDKFSGRRAGTSTESWLHKIWSTIDFNK